MKEAKQSSNSSAKAPKNYSSIRPNRHKDHKRNQNGQRSFTPFWALL